MKNNFGITRIVDGSGFNQVVLKNNLTKEFINILPDYGARLNKVYLLIDGELTSIVKELTDTELKTNDQLFNNALLFPFAGRIKNGKYIFNDVNYQLPINYADENNACHGFLFKEKFDIVSENIYDDFAEVVLSFAQIKEYTGYPFIFKISVSYKMYASGEVAVNTEVENLNSTSMLFSEGWHPYYTFDDCVDDCTVEFMPNEKIELDTFNIPDGKKIQFNLAHHHKIDLKNKKLDDVFKFLTLKDRNEIILTSKKKNDSLIIWQQAGLDKYNYLVLYTPPDRKSIAIEPITSNINSFNSKEDVIILEAGSKWNSSFGFKTLKNK